MEHTCFDFQFLAGLFSCHLFAHLGGRTRRSHSLGTNNNDRVLTAEALNLFEVRWIYARYVQRNGTRSWGFGFGFDFGFCIILFCLLTMQISMDGINISDSTISQVSTLLWQQPCTVTELLIHPLSTTAVYNMKMLGCVRFDVGQPTGNGSPLPLGFATLSPLPKHIMAEFGLGTPSTCSGLKPEQVERLIQWHCACMDVFIRGKRPNIDKIFMEYQCEKDRKEEQKPNGANPLDKGYLFLPLKLGPQSYGIDSSNNVEEVAATTASLDWISVDAFLSPSEGGDHDETEGPVNFERDDLPVVWCRLSAKKARMYFVMQVMRLTCGEYMSRLKERRPTSAPVPQSPHVEQGRNDDNNKPKKVALEWASLVDNNFLPPIGLNAEESKTLSLAEWYTPDQRESSDPNQRLYLAYPAASAKEVFLHHVELTAHKLDYAAAHEMTTTSHLSATEDDTLSAANDDVVTTRRLSIVGGGSCADADADAVEEDNNKLKLKFRHRHTGPPRMLIPQYLTHVKLPRMICGALMLISPLSFDLERCLAVQKFADEVFRPVVLGAGRKWQLEPATHLLSCALQHGSFVGERLEIFGDHWLGFYTALYIILVVKEEELIGCYHADLVCNARLLVAAKKMGISSLVPSPRDWMPSMCPAPKEYSHFNWKAIPDVMEALIGCFVLTAGDYCGEALLEYIGYHTVRGLLKSQEEVDEPLPPPPANLTSIPTTEKQSMEEKNGKWWSSSPLGRDAIDDPPPGQKEAAASGGSRTSINRLHMWPLFHCSFVHFQSILKHGTIFPVEYKLTCPAPELMNCVLQVEKILSYKFRVPWLCLQALTHSSSVEEDPLWLAEDAEASDTAGHVVHVKSSDYERLYFLGSFILNHIVMAHLYHWDTMLTPEDLTNLRSSITLTARLNLIAIDTLGLLDLYRGGSHYRKVVTASVSGERENSGGGSSSTMAKEMSKILKSLMAAIFLDSDGCLAVVSKVFWPFLAPAPQMISSSCHLPEK